MRISSQIVCLLSVGMLFFEVHAFALADTRTPHVPETSIAQEVPVQWMKQEQPLPDPRRLLAQLTKGDDYPAQLIIPSINLNTSVIKVGVNAKGEMDVPDGKSPSVGWYEHGTVPGDLGSAVIDAHVYAAFKNLRYAKVGDDIYVVTKSGKRLHFRIQESTVYKTEEISADRLFNASDARRLNLITCAGKYIPSRETYNKRLVVHAVLVDEST